MVHKNRLYFREFLNLPGHHGGAYVLAEVGDTTGQAGSHVEPDVVLEIADCSRRISLDFQLYDEPARRNSLRKVRLLADVLARFADALEAEAGLAAQREGDRRAANPDRGIEPSGPVNGSVDSGVGSTFAG